MPSPSASFRISHLWEIGNPTDEITNLTRCE
jgi:hypothetical protein